MYTVTKGFVIHPV